MEDQGLCCKFKCSCCSKELELPLCCNKESIQIMDNKVYCGLCGSKKIIPACCGEVKFEGIE